METRIGRIPSRRRREVAALLTEAFLADEHFARFFPEPDSTLPRHVAQMFDQGCEAYETSGATIVAATQGARIVGALM